jgi:hypothetical protein
MRRRRVAARRARLDDQVREGGDGGRRTRRSPERHVYMRESVMAH